MDTNGFFTLNWRDLGRGAIVALFTGFMLPLLAVLQTPDFSFVSANWDMIWVLAVNGGLSGLAGYLMKNLFSNKEGNFVGKV